MGIYLGNEILTMGIYLGNEILTMGIHLGNEILTILTSRELNFDYGNLSRE